MFLHLFPKLRKAPRRFRFKTAYSLGECIGLTLRVLISPQQVLDLAFQSLPTSADRCDAGDVSAPGDCSAHANPLDSRQRLHSQNVTDRVDRLTPASPETGGEANSARNEVGKAKEDDPGKLGYNAYQEENRRIRQPSVKRRRGARLRCERRLDGAACERLSKLIQASVVFKADLPVKVEK